MSATAHGSNWLELAGVLAVELTAVVALAAIAARASQAAVWRRTIWQVAVLGLAVLAAGELTGVARGIVEWGRGRLEGNWAASRPDHVNSSDLSAASFDRDVDPAAVTMLLQQLLALDGLSSDLESAGDLAEVGKSESPENAAVPRADSTAGSASEPSNTPALAAVARMAWWLGPFWAAGSALLVVRLLAARMLLVRFRQRHAVPDAALGERVAAVARRLGLRRRVAVVLSPALTAPIAFGTWRPAIGLPLRFAERFDATQQEAMLAHELAHLAARDPAWQLLADLVAAAVWWHPLVWWTRRQLREAGEAAADEASAVVHNGPAVLAQCLVELGTQLARPRPAAWVRMEGTGFRSSLGRRVERLLAMNGPARRPRRAWCRLTKTLAPAVMVAAALVGTAWSRPPFTQKGETMFDTIRHSWHQSVAAVAIVGLFGAGDATVLAGAPAASLSATDDSGQKPVKEAQAAKEDKGAAKLAEVKERLATLQREAEELLKLGREEEAKKLLEKARALEEMLADGGKGEKGPVKERFLLEKIVKKEDLDNRQEELRRAIMELEEKMELVTKDSDDFAKLQAQRASLAEKLARLKDDESAVAKKGKPEKGGDEVAELREKLKQLEAENAKLRAALKSMGDISDQHERARTEYEKALKLDKATVGRDEAVRQLQALQEALGLQQAHQRRTVEELQALYSAAKAKPAEDAAVTAKMLQELREELSKLRDEVAELRHMVKGQGDKKGGEKKDGEPIKF